MFFEIDPKFLEYFQNLEQVFLYITDECNLRCVQCLYKPNLTFHLVNKDIPLETAMKLISDFREMGATKLTIMGGEPTLYGKNQASVPLFDIIKMAKESLGYEYVRIDTNGIFSEDLLHNEDFKKLDEITFSLDGYTADINDPVRGPGTFDKCVSNIEKAVKYGYNVDITCCLHKGLVRKDNEGVSGLDAMISFASSLGVGRINFHDLFKTGIPRDEWTGNIEPQIEEWMSAYEVTRKKIDAKAYPIPVRIPQCFITKEEFVADPEYYGYCPVKMGERILVHPNGILRTCSLMISTPYGLARFFDNKISWDKSSTNELSDHELDQSTPCTNQNKSYNFNGLIPLCVSFKPKQKEYVWEKIRWENQKKE